MATVFPPTEPTTVSVINSDLRFPVRRIFCVGRNYADHAREMGANPDREAPFFFTKPGDTIVESGHPINYPSQTQDLQHEVEMVLALQHGGENISQEQALDCVFGYAVGIDLTRRDLQSQAKSAGRPWCTGKAFDQSAPIGPITQVGQCGHIDQAAITLEINGKLIQSGDINQMIWSSAEIIATLSNYFCLAPGDLIYTGTPAGVGPLQRGDQLRAEITGLAPLTAKVA